MSKILNILFIILILVFFWTTYKYYSSTKNLKIKEFNRNNIDQIINKKISNLPILKNDTNNVIEFNNSILGDAINDKPRSFWNLLK
jgi:dipeptide/tripeptide permease